MLRVVLDTSVLVSTVLSPNGVPAQVFTAWRAHCYSLFTTPAILKELLDTLAQPRIRRRYPVTDAKVDAILELLRELAVFVRGTADVSDSGLRDPNDHVILSAAAEARAHVLVSSDKDLLVLGTYRDTEIVTPRQFLDRFVPPDARS
jgi:putative PIN family toxin of toxin-antitoxin system